MKKILTLGVTLLALAGLTACQSDDATLESNGRTVTLRVQAKYPGYNVEGPETRTTMAVESGKLKCRWNAGDQIYVTNTSGTKVGYLTLEEGAGEEYGYFSGTLQGLPEGTNNYMFAYLGSGLNAQTKTGGTFSIDLSNQDNTITSFPKYDVLITRNTITVTDDEAVCSDLSFIRQMAYAHFKLNLPTGVTRGTEPVTISGTNISFRRDYDLSVPNVVDNTNTSVITVNGRGNDLYVALAPMQNSSKPTLSVTIGGVEYSATLDAKTLTRGTYYCGSQTSDPGIAVAMTGKEDEWVDLGLPSGLLWNKYNIGAESPEESGTYFGWGDYTATMTVNNASKYGPASIPSYAKSSTESSYGTTYYYIESYWTQCRSQYDIAYKLKGSDTRMPDSDDCYELKNNTNYSKTTLNGTKGWKFVSKKDSSKWIFIPCAGYKLNGSVRNNGYMYVWLSSLCWFDLYVLDSGYWYVTGEYGKRAQSFDDYAKSGNDVFWSNMNPSYGFPVRPVKDN